MERVSQNVEKLQLYGINGEALKVTISIGLAEVNTKPKVSPYRSEISEVLALADEQLYRAKHQGRNQVCCVQPESSTSVSQAG
jgi:diguanylate cyclase (GGDEF)-like protein